MREKSILVADYKNRVIWLDGEITPKISKRFSKILKKLNKQSCLYVTFYIRGPGGEPFSLFSMMSDIFNSNSPVACVAHSYVNSGCFTLTQAGSFRLAVPGTKFCFHPTAPNFDGYKYLSEVGQADLERWLIEFKKIDGVQLQWFFRKGRPTKRIFELFNEEAVLSIPSAIKLKLIDGYYKKADFNLDKKRISMLLN